MKEQQLQYIYYKIAIQSVSKTDREQIVWGPVVYRKYIVVYNDLPVSLLAEVSHGEAKMRERRETSASREPSGEEGYGFYTTHFSSKLVSHQK